jgi:hypothetical protein
MTCNSILFIECSQRHPVGVQNLLNGGGLIIRHWKEPGAIATPQGLETSSAPLETPNVLNGSLLR